MKELLHKFSGCLAIFFPVRRLSDGGTCQFATEQCLRECAAFKNASESNKIPYDEKVRIYKRVTEASIFGVCSSFVDQLSRCEPPRLLYWFASGDCPSKHQDRISTIMKYLSEQGVTQVGFTRNIDLWEETHELKGTKFVLTVEDEADIDNKIRKSGLYAVPNYKTGRVRVIRNTWVVKEPRYEYHCPPPVAFGRPYRNKPRAYWRKDTVNPEFHADCRICLNEAIGCFVSIND